MSKITIIGRGLDPSKHLSLAAIQALKKADIILGMESEKSFWNELQQEFKIQKVNDLSNIYKNNEKDIINYQTFVDTVLELSSKYEQIALLVAGHPRIGVSFINMLQQSSSKINIEVIEGISSFDVMLNYLELDPLEAGTAILDANRMLLFKYLIEPSICYFIYHVCSVGNSKTNFLNPAENNHVKILKNYLLKFYKESKTIFLCRMSNSKNQISKKIPIFLKDLDRDLHLIDFSTTLYVPAEDPKSLDFNYLNLLQQL